MGREPCEASCRIPLLSLLDRMLKTNMLEFVRSRLNVQRSAKDDEPEMPVAERVPFVVDIVTKMRDEAARRGSDFVFVLMPYDPTLDQAVIKLKELGVKIIAYMPRTSVHRRLF